MKEVIIDNVKIVKTKEIRDEDTTIAIWETDIRLPDGDVLVLYERIKDEWGFESISFNPFNGIPTDDVCIDAINLEDAQKILGLEHIDDEICHLAVAIEIFKKITRK
jgi:hypothetical protein